MPKYELELEILSAAAASVLPFIPMETQKKYATWAYTRPDEDFDVESTLKYLQSKGDDIDLELLERYSIPNRPLIPLKQIGTVSDWIECIPDKFQNYKSFKSLHASERFEGIFTFTTPAVSATGTQAFLEVWTEDGRYSQMGCWIWVLLAAADSGWHPIWERMHKMS